MNVSTGIVVAVLITMACLALRAMIKGRKSGSGCGSCSGCSCGTCRGDCRGK